MAIRRYYILAAEEQYSPSTDGTITYRVESDTTVRNFTRAQPHAEQQPVVTELIVHIQYVDRNWGPNVLRIEGFTRNPRTAQANRVIGHHMKEFATDSQHRIGFMEVTEDN